MAEKRPASIAPLGARKKIALGFAARPASGGARPSSAGKRRLFQADEPADTSAPQQLAEIDADAPAASRLVIPLKNPSAGSVGATAEVKQRVSAGPSAPLGYGLQVVTARAHLHRSVVRDFTHMDPPEYSPDVIVHAQMGSRPKKPMPEKPPLLARRIDETAKDPPSLSDYAAVPVEEFGKAMLRGMGWDESADATPKPIDLTARPARLGLGARPPPAKPPGGGRGRRRAGRDGRAT